MTGPRPAPVHLLALGPHPDDVEFSCGGLVAAASSRGQRAVIVDLTRGERASNGTPALRAEEAARAAEVLGAARENLALPDGGLAAGDHEQIAAIVEVVRRLQPELALAPCVDARHPDHAAAGELARAAAFWSGVARYRPDLGAPFRPRRWLHYPQRHEARPDLVVDVSAVYDTKLAAVQCHRSQVGGDATGREEPVPTIVNQPLGRRAFVIRDQYWGASIGVEHGEPYVLGTPVPVSDPVAHFAAHPATPVIVP